MSENDNHGKQFYQLNELHEIRRAAGRPVLFSVITTCIGLVLCYAAYNSHDAASAVSLPFLAGAVLMVGGTIGVVIYGLNYLAVNADTHNTERKHLMKWAQIANNPDMRRDDPLKQLAQNKLDDYYKSPAPSMFTPLGCFAIVAVIAGAVAFVMGYFK